MADSNGAKNFKFDNIITEFGGYNSASDKTKLNPALMVGGSLNVYKKINGNIANRPGLKRRGTADSTLAGVNSTFIWNSSWGDIFPLWVANGKLQVEITTGTDTYQWVTIATTSQTRWVFDAWWDSTLKKDKMIACNGTTNLYSWAGGVATIASTTATTITKNGTSTWTEAHFESTGGAGSVVINGTTYSYTGGSGTTTLTGVTPNPTGEANGSYVISPLITTSNKPDSSFNADFLKVIGNRAYVGSYTSNLIYISSKSDYKDYTIPGTVIPGSPAVQTLDGTAKGISIRQGNAIVSYGTSNWASLVFSTYSNSTGTLLEQLVANPFPVQSLGAAYAHEFIDTSGDNIIYLSQDQQVRYLGNTNNSFFTVFPSLSQEIYTELQEEDFTLGQLNCIGDFIYLTAPNSAKTYIYQARQAIDSNTNVVAERLWYAPFIWSASRVDAIDGRVVIFSNANPQVYYGWDTNQYYDDSPSDEELPYESKICFAYRVLRNRAFLQQFDKVFTEGYLTPGTDLNLTINYNFNGVTNTITVPINSSTVPAYTFAPNYASLGDSSLGELPIGDIFEVDDQSKFKSIKSVSETNCFEYQLIYSTSTTNDEWEILANATNADVVSQQPTFIISKQT